MMEVNEMARKNGRHDREEYGYGYDLSPDDLDVIGQNNDAKKQHKNDNKKPSNKQNPSRLNE